MLCDAGMFAIIKFATEMFIRKAIGDDSREIFVCLCGWVCEMITHQSAGKISVKAFLSFEIEITFILIE
jgi:hypothetical protein